ESPGTNVPGLFCTDGRKKERPPAARLCAADSRPGFMAPGRGCAWRLVLAPAGARGPRADWLRVRYAFILGQGRKMHLECLVGRKPAGPFGLAGDVVVKKADARPPCAVQTIDGGLPENTHPPAVGKLRHGEQLLVGGGVPSGEVDLLHKGVGLERAGTENDGICPGQLLHPA